MFGIERDAVQGVDAVLDGRRFSARRAPGGWELDGRPASAASADALEDLVETVAGLRAIDAFRARGASSYGLDRPRGAIELATSHGARRLTLGALNSAGSAFYARRTGDPRVVLVGTIVLSDVERVLYTRDGR